MYLHECEDGGWIAVVEARVWHDRATSMGGGGGFERREGGQRKASISLPPMKVETGARR
jgi:hypothetical protein